MEKFLSFIAGEALSLSVGFLAGWLASNLVSKYFVKRGLVNLWGLTTKRNALKKDHYEWLMFITSYLIGLMVMLIVQFCINQLKG